MDISTGRAQDWPRTGAGIGSLPRVSVLSVNYNTRLLIAQSIYSVYAVCPLAELAAVIVVDNASRDGSQQLLNALVQEGCAT